MSKATNRVRLPAGVRDYLPRAAARRRSIADRLSQVFESWGYQRIITPVVEVAEVLDRGLGDADRDRAVRFVEPYSGQVVALRPDITPQIARIAATRMDGAGLPARLCYEGSVTRLNPRAGGQREILQAGIELIDMPSPHGDAETLAVAAAALQATGLSEFRIDLGHVEFSRFALEHCKSDEDRERLTAALTRKDRSTTRELARTMGGAAAKIVEALPTLYGPRAKVLARARSLPLPASLKRALAETESVLKHAAELMPASVHQAMSLDMGEVRGFDYYTGIRFRGFADGVGHAILRGGRYDQLVGKYGRDAAAIGFALDVEAVAEAQDALGMAAPKPSRGLFILGPKARAAQAQAIAAQLRTRGHRVAVHQLSSARDSEAAMERAKARGWSHLLYWRGQWCGRAASGGDKKLGSAAQAAAAGRIGALSKWISAGE